MNRGLGHNGMSAYLIVNASFVPFYCLIGLGGYLLRPFSRGVLDKKINAVRNAAQPSVKDLHDFYEETHKKLGRGIANLWEVINLGEEIEYVY